MSLIKQFLRDQEDRPPEEVVLSTGEVLLLLGNLQNSYNSKGVARYRRERLKRLHFKLLQASRESKRIRLSPVMQEDPRIVNNYNSK